MSKRRAFVGLGSNLGEREATLFGARERLAQAGLEPLRVSGLYWTEPVGGPPQEWFLNQVLLGATELEPEALLEACLAVERQAGRVRDVRYGPRTLDLDLLLYEGERRDSPGLQLPHPRMHERRFVLVPLAEIAPDERLPDGRDVAALLAACPDRSAVELYSPAGTR